MCARPLKPSRTDTRERILDAAMLRFSRHSYEDTGLRDIAADVGVDVAYVHRCFGSKERLFEEALTEALATRKFLDDASGDLADALAGRLFSRRAARADQVAPLDIIVRSLLSPAAAPLLRIHLEKDVVAPLAAKIARPPDGRAATLAAAFMIGVAILKHALRLESLRDSEGGALEQQVAHALRAILADDRP